MKLIVGLGNPGSRYSETRHNVGFAVIESLAEEAGIKISKKGFGSLWAKGEVGGEKVLFLLPQTFMNLSGRAVREAKGYYDVATEDVIVAHDDLDLLLGRLKLDFDAGAAGHRGVTSMIEELGTKAFHRVRIGIGRPARKKEVEGFVLSPFSAEEWIKMQETILEAKEKIKQWIVEAK